MNHAKDFSQPDKPAPCICGHFDACELHPCPQPVMRRVCVICAEALGVIEPYTITSEGVTHSYLCGRTK